MMEILNFVLLFVIFAALTCLVLPSYFNNISGGKTKSLKNSDIKNIPDDKLETEVINWLFSQVDTKGVAELSVVRAMPAPCRAVYSVYIVAGEICSGGFAMSFEHLNSYFFSEAICGFLYMKAGQLAEIIEKACGIAGEYIRENGKDNISSIEDDKTLTDLQGEFCSCEDMINLSDKIVNYIRENSECFGD